MAVKNETPPVEAQDLEPETSATPEPLPVGFHVMLDGASLGCYPIAADAEAFANAHPRADGLTVVVEEVKG